MSKLTISKRITLAIGVPLFLFISTTTVAYYLIAGANNAQSFHAALVYLSIMTSLGGVIAVAAAVVLFRGILHPVSDLTLGIEAFDCGDLTYRIKSDNKDEFGLLAAGLNRMADDRQMIEAKLEDLTFNDPVTKLANRAQFQSRLKDAIGEANRNGGMFSVQLMDLDNFQQINDTLGHPIGDKLLRDVSQRLVQCSRETDTVARLGGDEFVIIQNHLTDKLRVERLAQRVLNRLTEKFEIDAQDIHTGASIGISIFPDDADNTDDLLRGADLALYRAKQEGRAKYSLYDKELDREVKQQTLLENDLRDAISKNALHLVYQPKLKLETGETSGVEALIRWNRCNHGPVPTDKFIAAAEQSGMITQLTDFVLRQTCEDARDWGFSANDCLHVSVNLSALDFKRQDFLVWLAGILENGKYDPANLELEITERTLMDNDDALRSLLMDLRKMGVEISIDDFGTGYSSLQYLKNFPISKVKIDKVFIRDITTDTSDANITRSVISMAHGLNMKTIAEGVETLEQKEYLQEIGCDEIQGYYYSRPLSSNDLSSFLAPHNVDKSMLENRSQ